MIYRWADCDRDSVRQRYDRIAKLIPLFDRLFFVPGDLRQKAVERLGLDRGDNVLEIGCGTGNSFSYLYDAVGPTGRIYGVDISSGMLRRAKARLDANHWHNIELCECDAVDYLAPVPLNGVLFSFSYNTMPHHRSVLRKAWNKLQPGGRLVIVDAKLPPGFAGHILLPFSLWLMKRTMLGNPLVHPWEELAAVADHVEMNECLFGSYYICHATKAFATQLALEPIAQAVSLDVEHRIAAE